MDDLKKGAVGDVGDVGEIREAGTNHPDFKEVAKPAVEEKPARIVNPLVTHNTGAK